MPSQYGGGRSLSEWTDFLQKSEASQARFLLDMATAAWEAQREPTDIGREVCAYLKLGYEVLEGNHEKLPHLIRFLEDPDMKHDFGAFYERLQHEETASAALDLASYACGFVSRMSAAKSEYGPLPDPVLEAMPEIYEYYQERAGFLGV